MDERGAGAARRRAVGPGAGDLAGRRWIGDVDAARAAGGAPPETPQISFADSGGVQEVSRAYGLGHDPLAQLFWLRGQPLRLSRQEYRLLRFLAAHPRQLLSREQLLAGAWDDALEHDHGALNACLYRLRQALGPDAERLIENQRNAGYRFEPEPRRGAPFVSEPSANGQ